ncbi:hypothetical protein [Shewanella sp.]|uniref:hypothetical protein n=1 Tax=Shewanella sp. TaxID=50422 RepID=UPI004054652D
MLERKVDKIVLQTCFFFFDIYLPVPDDDLSRIMGVSTEELKRIRAELKSDDGFYINISHSCHMVHEAINTAILVCHLKRDTMPHVPDDQFIEEVERKSDTLIKNKILSGNIKLIREAISDMAMYFGIDVAF